MAGEHLEQRRFTGAVGADHADDATGRQGEVEPVDQLLVAHVLLQTFDLDHLVAEARTVGDDDLGAGKLFAFGLFGHLVIGRDTGLGFRLTCLGALAHPFKLALQRLLLGLVLARFLRQPLGLLLQPVGVVALVGNTAATVEFEDPAGDVVEEVAVMGDAEDGALVVDQVLLQPSDGLGVEVVGRLIEQQHVGCFEKQLTERHAARLTAREVFRHRVVRRAAQRFHRDVDLAVEVPEVLRVDVVLQLGHLLGGLIRVVHRQFVVAVEDRLLLGHTFHDVFAHGLGRVELGFLRQVADLGTLGSPCLAREILVEPGHDLEQGGLTRAVDADNTDLHAGQEV